jgi:hypothetical protein
MTSLAHTRGQDVRSRGAAHGVVAAAPVERLPHSANNSAGQDRPAGAQVWNGAQGAVLSGCGPPVSSLL